MKFTDGFWQLRPGVTALYAQEAYDIWETDTLDGPGLVITAPTKVIERRGDTLNRATLTVTLSSPAEGVVRVRIVHHDGGTPPLSFGVAAAPHATEVEADAAGARLGTGSLTARIAAGAPWSLEFFSGEKRLTGSGHKAQGYITLAHDAQVDPGIVDNARAGGSGVRAHTFVHEQLDLGVGELIYGLGERSAPSSRTGRAWRSGTPTAGPPVSRPTRTSRSTCPAAGTACS